MPELAKSATENEAMKGPTAPSDRAAPETRQVNGDVPTFLIVDDNESFRVQLGKALERRGFLVRCAGNVEEALALAREDSPEYAIVDLRMPGGNGLVLLKDLREIDPTTKILILTGYGSISTAVSAMKMGAVNYLPKPANADEILAAFQRGELPHDDEGADQAADETPSLSRVEWEHIHRVLADCGGNLSETARRLDIHRRSLQRKLRKSAP